jgi:hypothetical protein
MKALGILFPGAGAAGGLGGSGGGISDIGNWQQYAFAEGGFVTNPTKALVGEGGANEYVIPENKMGNAMRRYNSGMRGDAVISGAEAAGSETGAMGAEPPTQINISGGVTQFGGNDYIRQDQLPSIISQAGKAGEARALRKLQMSPGTRRKVGIA